MIITDSNKSDGKGIPPVEEPLVETLPAFNEAVASSSSPHPSSRMPVASRSQEEIRPLLLRGIDDNPPEFSTWDAQYSLTSHGDVVSTLRITPRLVVVIDRAFFSIRTIRTLTKMGKHSIDFY